MKNNAEAGTFSIAGQVVDVIRGTISPGEVFVDRGKVGKILRLPAAPLQTIMPGLVDSHVHVESSMVTPASFGRIAPIWGTVGTVSDPHEIANVLGLSGVHYMLEDAGQTLLKIRFGVPSCVPATAFETAGGRITAADSAALMGNPRIYGTAEMMNYPAILNEDPAALAILQTALSRGKVCDGHFPRGRGEEARKYASFGITTDHECVSAAEARDKIAAGMKILIREGSAAKNFAALIELLGEHPDEVMFCSDDLHPDRLVFEGHINLLVARAVALGHDPISVIRAATKNPVEHYSLDIGLLQEGDPADMIVVDSPSTMNVIETYIEGVKVAENGRPLQDILTSKVENNFHCLPISVSGIQVEATAANMRVIGIIPGELVSDSLVLPVKAAGRFAVSDPERDVLKLVVINRYREAPPAVGFVRGMGIGRAAIAGSVAHDSHNVIAVGGDDGKIVSVSNAVIKAGGGIAIAIGDSVEMLPLPIAGLMANGPAEMVASEYRRLDALAKGLGSPLPAPFMTLSFLALLVIPSLKLSDRGLFDGSKFEFTELFIK